MKKIAIFVLMFAVLVAFVTVVSAEEIADISETEGETAESTIALTAPESSDEIDFDRYAERFVEYIFSNSDEASDLMDKIIAIGEQYQTSKEQGYTLEERVNQMLTPENIITTVSATFLVVCGIAFFIFRHRQKIDTGKITVELNNMKKKYEKETETNKELRENILKQTEEINQMKLMLTKLTERSNISKQDMAHIEHTAVAVAKMVKDVFLNSKTIDASGKALLVHNYVEALGEVESVAKESDNEQQD